MKYDLVIITSDEPYSDNWHTQVIYAEYLSRITKVLFAGPPGPWSLRNLANTAPVVEVKERLRVITYRNVLPYRLNIINEWINQRRICKEAGKWGAKKILVWHFDSFRNALDSPLFTREFDLRRIYHVIDPFWKNPLDRKLRRNADLVIVASRNNRTRYAEANDVFYLPQAIDVALAGELLEKPASIAVPFPRYHVLLGTVSDDLDFEALSVIAKDAPVVIAGKIAGLDAQKGEFDRLIESPNVFYAGLLHPREFYPLLKSAAAGLVLYNSEKRSREDYAVLKFLHYLAAGIPVLTNTPCGAENLLGACIYESGHSGTLAVFAAQAMEGRLGFNKKKADGYLYQVSMENAVKLVLAKLDAV